MIEMRNKFQVQSTYIGVEDPILSPSWPGALNSHESEIKLHPEKSPGLN